ncbi:hypothetical protein ACHAQH_000244 [Verticillium albo-atrum]
MASIQDEPVQGRHQPRLGLHHSKHNPKKEMVTRQTEVKPGSATSQTSSTHSPEEVPHNAPPTPSTAGKATNHQIHYSEQLQRRAIIENQLAQQPTSAMDDIAVPDIIGISLPSDESLNIHANLHPTHFLMRPGPGHIRSIVPLIPLDLLPEHVDIVGLPRYLSPTQTARMSSVGTHDKAKDTPRYKLHIMQPTQKDPNKNIDVPIVTNPCVIPSARHPQIMSVPVTSLPAGTSPPAFGLEAAAPASAHRLLTPPKPSSGSGRGYYCRHYCHHGTCKWGNRCRYQHVMPNSASGLAEVGLKGFPAWYRAVVFNVNGSVGVLDRGTGMQSASAAEEERQRRDRETTEEVKARSGEERMKIAMEVERVEMERLQWLRGKARGVGVGIVEGAKFGEEEVVQQRLLDLD